MAYDDSQSDENVARFQQKLREARDVCVLTGAGISAESGIPTFRGAGGLWHDCRPEDVATPKAWERDAGFVWAFYDARRRNMLEKTPNPGHYALAELERRMFDAGRRMHVVTQNIDDLHLDAGSQHVTRLHGSIWQTRCTGCFDIRINRDVPIAPAFSLADDAAEEAPRRRYEAGDLPRCSITTCNGIVRPNVVWFGEALDFGDLSNAERSAAECDLFLVVGTSAVVYPAAQLVPTARMHGATVVEVNTQATPMSDLCDMTFHGPAGEWLPRLLDVNLDTL